MRSTAGADEIWAKLTVVLQDIFDDDQLVATPELTADDVLGWDSFAHMRLIVAIERSFAVTFTAAEAFASRNVGELAEIIGRKAAQ